MTVKVWRETVVKSSYFCNIDATICLKMKKVMEEDVGQRQKMSNEAVEFYNLWDG